MRLATTLMAVGLGLFCCVPGALAQRSNDADRVRASRISLADAISIARTKFPDALAIEIQTRNKGGRACFEVALLTREKSHELLVACDNGDIVESETKVHDAGHATEFQEFYDKAKAAKVDLEGAIKAAQAYMPDSTVFELELEPEDGVLVVEADVEEAGKQARLDIDATTHKVLKVNNRPAIEGAQVRGSSIVFNFDRDPDGSVPRGWKAREGEKLSAVWTVKPDASAPSAKNVLTLAALEDSPEDAFNLCWTSGPSFHSGDIEARFRADSGRKDQGGGIVWRVANDRNYYLLRLNPLEKNVRLYHVVDGVRTQLASAETAVPLGEWHTLKVEHKDEAIRCFVDGVAVFDAKDAKLPKAGGIGVWTKSDAETSFDNVTIHPSPAGAR